MQRDQHLGRAAHARPHRCAAEMRIRWEALRSDREGAGGATIREPSVLVLDIRWTPFARLRGGYWSTSFVPEST